FGRAFHAVAEAIAAQGLVPVGPPFGLYRGMPDTTIDVAAGFPVNGPLRPYGKVTPDELPTGLAVVAMHVGPFDTMAETYAGMQGWMAERAMFPGDIVWESYLTDPSVEPDIAKWRTEIVWPVAQAMIVM
ncbi:MAG: GyrI-like domain-containing protein, partial [Acidimicrobiia bacterium]|nr:GyrI-like domain-containing protein [Acidimicrobiia bacterium]